MYDVNYFIKKFEDIPENKWITGALNIKGKCCIQGHLGITYGNCMDIWNKVNDQEHPYYSLHKLFSIFTIEERKENWKYHPFTIAQINNGDHPKYQQSTPKQRILAALYDIKAMQEAKVEISRDRIVYVAIPETIKKQIEHKLLNAN